MRSQTFHIWGDLGLFSCVVLWQEEHPTCKSNRAPLLPKTGTTIVKMDIKCTLVYINFYLGSQIYVYNNKLLMPDLRPRSNNRQTKQPGSSEQTMLKVSVKEEQSQWVMLGSGM